MILIPSSDVSVSPSSCSADIAPEHLDKMFLGVVRNLLDSRFRYVDNLFVAQEEADKKQVVLNEVTHRNSRSGNKKAAYENGNADDDI